MRIAKMANMSAWFGKYLRWEFQGIFSQNWCIQNRTFLWSLWNSHSQPFTLLQITSTSQNTHLMQETQPKFARAKGRSSAAQRPKPRPISLVTEQDARCRGHQWLLLWNPNYWQVELFFGFKNPPFKSGRLISFWNFHTQGTGSQQSLQITTT